jgi:hypothetical protein
MGSGWGQNVNDDVRRGPFCACAYSTDPIYLVMITYIVI